MTETAFADKVEILSDLWMYHRSDEDFENLFEYADLGLPLAYAKSTDLIDALTTRAVDLINEAFDMLLGTLRIEEDAGYESLDELLGSEEYEIPVVYINEEEEEEDTTATESYESGFTDGAQAEQKRVQEVISMHKRWAKEKNRASEFMFWDSAGEVLTPINFEYSEEKYYEDLKNEGF